MKRARKATKPKLPSVRQPKRARGTNHLACPLVGCHFTTRSFATRRMMFRPQKLTLMAEHLRHRHDISFLELGCPCCDARFDTLNEWKIHFIMKRKQIMAVLTMDAHAKLLGADYHAKQ